MKLSLGEKGELVETDVVIKETPRPSCFEVQEAFQKGWVLDEKGRLHLPGDPSIHWCANWCILPDIRVPHWLRRRMDEIANEAEKDETEQAQEVSIQTQTFFVASSQYPSTHARDCSENSVGGELVEQRTPSYIQEVESSLHGLRSPCERG